MAITLSNLNIKEATPGLEIGTLSNDYGTTGTYTFNLSSQPSFLTITGDKVSLATNWFLDFETKHFIKFGVTHDSGRVTNYSPSAYYLGVKGDQPKLPIKFTTDLGQQYAENIQINITDQTEKITVTPIKVKQNQYGAILAEITTLPNSSEEIYFEGPQCFEIAGNKLKLTDDYYYSENGSILKWTGDGAYASFNMGAKNDALNIKLITPSKYEPSDTNDYGKVTLTQDSYRNSIFGNSNLDKTAIISLTPTKFYDKKFGAEIATINYTGGSETVEFKFEKTHTYFEISGNKLKLKDSYYYDNNTGWIVKRDFTGNKLADAGSLILTATNKSNSKKISTEEIPISEISTPIFGSDNVQDKDESYTFVTDVKYVDATTPRNKEYQKLISSNHWKLEDNETISYAFLGPGSSYDNTQKDIKEFSGLVAVTDAFKTAAKSAFNNISSFAKINFKEITESGDVTADFRIGIADKDAFAMDAKYGAYSQGITNFPKGGNIFFNGGVDKNGNNIVDYNEADYVKPGSWHYATFLHEIGHSLGLKHPFEDLSGGTSKSSEIMGDQYDQYRYSLMSYTPIIDQSTYADYEGINLNANYGGGSYYPDTLMLYDVMSLQEIYGKNSNSTGDDTYAFEKNKPPFKAIYDTGGSDTLDLSKIVGGTTLDLSGNKISLIGSDYLRPWKNEEGKSSSTYGDYQPSSFSIIEGTEIEKILLPEGQSNITSGTKSSFFVGNTDSVLNITVNSDQIGVKASGTANDTINLVQTTSKWGTDVQARNMGNAGKGATSDEITKMSDYLKHDISINTDKGIDTLNATAGNDALFLQNFSTSGDDLWYKDAGSNASGARLIGLNKINLLEGNNFLDLTSTTTSLSSETLEITSGSGNDILWLSDANENINSGNGDDQITLNGGTDNLTTGAGKDILTISNYKGNLTVTDFDVSKDKFDFKAQSNKVSAVGNKITVSNSLGDYVIILSNNPDLSDISPFSTFV